MRGAVVARGEEELDILIEQTRQEYGDDEDGYCLSELTLLWAEAHAFYHRQMRIQHDDPAV